MTKGCFLAAFRSGSSSHPSGYLQFGSHCGSVFDTWSTVVLQDVELPGLYEVIRMVWYNPVLRLLKLRCSQHIGWSCYGGKNPIFLTYYFYNGYLYDIPQLSSKKWSNTDTGVIAIVTGHEI